LQACLCCCAALQCTGQVDAALGQLRDALRQEVRLQESLLRLSGCLEPILAAALLSGASVA
jgi:hypothetical protein